MKTRIEFIRFGDNYVCHYTELLESSILDNPNENYVKALKNSKEFGGKAYNNKKYGGGIAFKTQDPDRLGVKIEKWRGTYKKYGVMLGKEELFSSDDILACEAWKNTISPEKLKSLVYIQKF